MFAGDQANTSRIKSWEQGAQEIILPEHSGDGKIGGVKSIKSPWDYPEENAGYIFAGMGDAVVFHAQTGEHQLHPQRGKAGREGIEV